MVPQTNIVYWNYIDQVLARHNHQDTAKWSNHDTLDTTYTAYPLHSIKTMQYPSKPAP